MAHLGLAAAMANIRGFLLDHVGSRKGLFRISGGLFFLTPVVHELFGILALSISVLALCVAVGTVGLMLGNGSDDGVAERDLSLARLETIAERWLDSDPVLQPAPENLHDGQQLLEAVSRLGVPKGMSPTAEQFMLLLSIQYGQRWWLWFKRARKHHSTASLLMVPLRTASLGWIRVAARAAYLLQCVDRAELDAAVDEEFGSSPPASVLKFVEAARSGQVISIIKEADLSSQVAQAERYVQLLLEMASAEAELRCGHGGTRAL